MINLDKQLLQEIEESSCFGIAYDATVPECKQCDLTAQCKSKSSIRAEGKTLPASDVKESTSAKKTKKSTKSTTKTKKKSNTTTPKKASEKKASPKKTQPKSKQNKKELAKMPGEMPEFKGMPWEEVQAIAKKHNVEYKDYGNENITRMRLVMTLKKMYE